MRRWPGLLLCASSWVAIPACGGVDSERRDSGAGQSAPRDDAEAPEVADASEPTDAPELAGNDSSATEDAEAPTLALPEAAAMSDADASDVHTALAEAGTPVIVHDGSAPAPIEVEVLLDSTRAVSADLPITGGIISATGADGSLYELSVPADALLGPTTITLTPVRMLRGLPVGESASSPLGVQFGPEGLFFYHPATLRIVPAPGSEIALERQLFVQWREGGKELSLAPVEASSEMRLPVFHFSGIAAVYTKGFKADFSLLRESVGGAAERMLQHELAEHYTRQRQRQLLGTADEEALSLQDKLAGYEDAFLQSVLQPRLDIAGTSCAAGRLAQETALMLGHQYQKAGLVDRWSHYAYEIAATVTSVCLREEYELCRDEHVLTRMMRVRLEVARQRDLLAIPPDAAEGMYDGYVNACYRFLLDFDGQAYQELSGNVKMTHTVEAHDIWLQLSGYLDAWRSGQRGLLEASAPLHTTQYSVTGGDECSSVRMVTPADSEVAVVSLSFVTGDPFFGNDRASDRLYDFKLVWLPLSNTSSFVRDSHCGGSLVQTFAFNWSTVEATMLLQNNPFSEKDRGYVVQGWNVRPSTEIGDKTFAPPPGTTPFTTLVDKFRLRHVPEILP